MTVKLNAKFVRHALADRDMTARDLASEAEIGEATMYRLLSGEAFSSVTLGKLAVALRCHPVDLIDADGFASPRLDAPAA